MSIIKLITTVSLAVALITMITSNSPSIYASPTTEDDGWTEGDYDGSQEEQEEQAQEDWEDAGRPGEIEDDGNGDDDENDDNDNDDGLVECEDGSLVETEELCEQSEVLVTCSDGSSAATQAECPSIPVSTFVTCSDGSSVATQAECPSIPTAAPTTQTCPDGSVVSVSEACPPTDKLLPDCDGSFQDCITPYGDICPAGSAAHECELPLPKELVQCSDGSTAESQELCPTEQLVQSRTCPNGVVVAVIQDCSPPDKELTQKEQQEWNKSCGDADEQAGESGQAFSKETYQHCGDEATGDKEYLKRFIAGCMKQDDMNEEDCSAETDRLRVWGDNPPTNQLDLERSGKPCNPGYVNIGNNLHVNCEQIKKCNVPFYMTCEKKDDKNGGSGSKSSSSSSSSSKTTIINPNADPNAAEVSNCRLDGSANGIQQKFDATKYLACGLFAAGQKAYSDGFVVGCTQIGNTQLVCQSLVDSSILNTKTQPIQTQTQAATQPTQTQPLTQPTQAIQPAAVN
jgi:hypothetical protein